MPAITDQPPEKVRADVAELRTQLAQTIPPKQLDHNLLIATWNLRAFGGLTEKWRAGPDDTPKRDYGDLACIAEIVSRFDVIAMQEVRGDIKALRHLLKTLGDQWAMILTDVTKGKAGNDERMAFLFDTRRVRPSGLACELVLPEEHGGRSIDRARGFRQFARTPYAVSFLAAGREYRATFILVTLHVIYGAKASERGDELKSIAGWLAEWARDVNGFDQNLIALGDFNIDRVGDANYEAFVSTGLHVPKELEGQPRTIFETSGPANYFDQIAWFSGEHGAPALSLRYADQGGSFDFVNAIHKDLTREDVSWKISDHYPLWVEFLLHDD
jgi:endonuclease/exonuclease/phosphatase family metal-dependent hydrolase